MEKKLSIILIQVGKIFFKLKLTNFAESLNEF